MTTGKLDVRIESDSYFLSERLPIEIRDTRHALVKTLEGSGTVSLEPGLYSVTAVLQDGQVQRQLTQVESGKTQPVKLVAPSESPRPRRKSSGISTGLPTFAPGAAGPLVTVEDVVGAEVVGPAEESVTFQPSGDPDGVPHATLRILDARREVSLPVNPRGYGEESQCTVTVVSGDRVHVELSPRRTVSSTMERMVRTGHSLRGAAVAGDALDLLASKYNDPVGAAYGGLLLHRLGRLGEKQAWVENLARDFAWLSDGLILSAALLMEDADAGKRAKGLERLLDASGRRMMFSDGFSLAMELLRRWPDADSRKERQARLRKLAPSAGAMDWDAGVVSVDKALRQGIRDHSD